MPSVTNLPDQRRCALIENLGQAGLDRQVVTELISGSTSVKYDKGSRPFLTGMRADNLLVILAGVVKVYAPQSNARRFLVQLAGPGEVIGFPDFLDGKGDRKHVFEAEAFTTCSISLVPRQRVMKYLNELDSGTLVSLIEQFNSLWSGIAHRYASMMSLSYRERAELILRELAEEFGVRDDRGVLINLEFGHEEWAEMVGCSRPMIGRLFAEMVNEGTLTRAGKRYILSQDGPHGLPGSGADRLANSLENGPTRRSPAQATQTRVSSGIAAAR